MSFSVHFRILFFRKKVSILWCLLLGFSAMIILRVKKEPILEELTLHMKISNESKKIPTYTSIICSDPAGRQMDQVLQLLKSLLTFASEKINYVILTTDAIIRHKILEVVSAWKYKDRLELIISPLLYPQEYKQFQGFYKNCATAKFLIPLILRNLSRVIFIDTDIIFMTPVERLWSHFENFSDQQMIGMNEMPEYYTFYAHNIPFYYKSGLSSGVMLMDLDKLRKINWTLQTFAILKGFKDLLNTGDQDVLNLFFTVHPEKVYTLPCSWRLVPLTCRQPFYYCEDIFEGANIMHGAGLAFYEKDDYKLVFSAWKEYQLGDSLLTLLDKVRPDLDQLDFGAGKGRCGFGRNITEVYFGQVIKRIHQIH